MKKLSIALLSIIFAAISAYGQKYDIIPYPQSLVAQDGAFRLGDAEKIVVPKGDAETARIAALFATRLEMTAGIDIPVVTGSSRAKSDEIVFSKVKGMGPEEYSLDVTSQSITIKAASHAGFFYAVQTLYQMLPAEVYGDVKAADADWSVAAAQIKDSPRFEYRGLMIDVSRMFYPKEYLLKLIDRMSELKINNFHLHLTDDQGWRVEIKKYPKLTEIGSTRPSTYLGVSQHHDPFIYDGLPYGSYFYTQDELREIVAYAAERYVEIIPEIDMPGHLMSAVASYPEIVSCHPEEHHEVGVRGWGPRNMLCIKKGSFDFMQDILLELFPIFPSRYFHIGGDECPKETWEACPTCRATMAANGLQNGEELQSYFIREMEKFCNANGKTVIGWDEIMQGGLAPNAVVMGWRGEKHGMKAATLGNKVIMTPIDEAYLNNYEEDAEFARIASRGELDIRRIYAYNPVNKDLDAAAAANIIGYQVSLWTLYIYDENDADYAIFPRLAAAAEVGWKDYSERDFDRFIPRMHAQYRRWEAAGLSETVCQSYYRPNIRGAYNEAGERYEISLDLFYPGGDIRYTLDEAKPTPSSTLYTGDPIVLTGDTKVRAAAFRDGKQLAEGTEKNFYVNKATGGKLTINAKLNPKGRSGAKATLTDGYKGFMAHLHAWVVMDPVERTEITLELRKPEEAGSVSFDLGNNMVGVKYPESVKVSVSADGRDYTVVGEKGIEYVNWNKWQRQRQVFEFPERRIKYVRIELQNQRLPGGKYARTAMDEIEVR